MTNETLHPGKALVHDIEAHPEPTSFWKKYVFSTNHKMIGKQYMLTSIFFLFVGGFLAMLIRWQLSNPGVPVPVVGQWLFPRTGGVIDPATYNTLFTMHGTIMIFLGLTPGWVAEKGTKVAAEDVQAHIAEIRDQTGYTVPNNITDEFAAIKRALAD